MSEKDLSKPATADSGTEENTESAKKQVTKKAVRKRRPSAKKATAVKDTPTPPDRQEPSRPSRGDGSGDKPGSRNRRRRRPRGSSRVNDQIGIGGDSPIDEEQLKKNAWKIFLAELSEEGVELFDDNSAGELARRSFRLAEVFLRYQTSHLTRSRPSPADGRENSRDGDEGDGSPSDNEPQNQEDTPTGADTQEEPLVEEPATPEVSAEAEDTPPIATREADVASSAINGGEEGTPATDEDEIIKPATIRERVPGEPI